MSIALRRLTAEQWRGELGGARRFVEPEADEQGRERLRALFGRDISAGAAVGEIVRDVRERGDGALREWTRRIDGVDVASTRADPAAMQRAWEQTPADVQRALRVAERRIRAFHELQRDDRVRGDANLGLRPLPLRRAGCYVPGGRAAYPSTVLMNAIPAQVAGVDSIAIASPPGPDGTVHPFVLAAAHLIGVSEVHAMGGAQAIAALAYGTQSIGAVDKIAGPGNLYVTLAKRAVVGAVGIDGMAGPSEVLVVAGEGADPRFVAADLVSQLEHDPLAWAVCITDSETLAAAVQQEFAHAAESAQRAGIVESAAGRHGMVVVCRDMEEALQLTDDFAPEHLELQGTTAEALAGRVRCAGAIFVGANSPVPMGDYIAGPNHTLPTGGAARFSGPLSVMDFVRWSSVTRLSAADMEQLGPDACTLAEAEGLHGHTESIRLRLSTRTPA
ncbi:MAG TPA: histidinol dehydrogenase [Candidatus Angelobacter sp.]|jgi:histidinol dehydrogenase|nr:histidinol dehydrogenase [Candidatus Angelobacter sp.]